MRKQLLLTACALAAVVCIGAVAHARVLGTSVHNRHFTRQTGGEEVSIDFKPIFRPGLPPPPPDPPGTQYAPFGMLTASAATVGMEYLATPASPDWTECATLLTNGLDNYIGMEVYHGDPNDPLETQFAPESISLTGGDFTGTDFAGVTLEAMKLRIDSHSSTYSGATAGPGEWVNEFQYTITYYGVPEPATVSLLAVGVVGLLRRRRRRA